MDFKKISLDDFEFDQKPLGAGTFGQVYKAVFKPDGQTYAIKILSKEFISKVSL